MGSFWANFDWSRLRPKILSLFEVTFSRDFWLEIFLRFFRAFQIPIPIPGISGFFDLAQIKNPIPKPTLVIDLPTFILSFYNIFQKKWR